MLDDVERRLFVRALSVTPETFGEFTEHDPEELFHMFLTTGERLFEQGSSLTSEELTDRVLSAESPSQVVTVIESAGLPYVEWVLHRLHRRSLELESQGRPAQAELARLTLETAWSARGTAEDRHIEEWTPPPDGERSTVNFPDLLSALDELSGVLAKYSYLRSVTVPGDQPLLARSAEFFEITRRHSGMFEREKVASYVALGFASGDPMSRVFARLEWMAYWNTQGRHTWVERHMKRLLVDIENAAGTRPVHELMEMIGQRSLEIDLLPVAVSAFRTASEAAGPPEPTADSVIWHARTRYKRAKGLRRLSQSAEALSVLQTALEYPWHETLVPERVAEARALKADVLTLLGLLHEDLGHYLEGRECYLAAAAQGKAAGKTQEVFTAYTYAMASLTKAGLHRSAAQEGYRLLDWTRTALLPGFLPAALNNVGHILSSAGRDDEAVALYREALALQRQLGTRSSQEMHSLFALGDDARHRGEVAEAGDLYASAFEAGKRVGDAYQATMLFYRKMAGIPQRITDELLVGAFRDAQQAQDTGDLGLLETALGVLLAHAVKENDHAVAMEVTGFFHEVATRGEPENETALRATLQYAETLCAYGGEQEKVTAFELLWTTRTRVVDEIHREGKTSSTVDTEYLRILCERLIALLFDHGGLVPLPDARDATELAFDLHEEAKSLHILARYARAKLTVPAGVPLELADREELLLGEIRELLDTPDDVLGPVTNRADRVRNIQDELTALHERMRTVAPAYVRLRESTPATLAETRAMLARRGDGASLVSYLCGRTTTWIFEVAADGTLTSAQAPVTRKELSDCAERLQRTFDGDESVFPPIAPLNRNRPWRRDLSFLDALSPLVDFSERATGNDGLVCVAPDGPLHGIPLHALKSPKDQRYIIEHTAVSYIPNISSLLYIAARASEARSDGDQSAFVAAVPTRAEDGHGDGDQPAELDDTHLLADAGWQVHTVPAVELTPSEVLSRLGHERVMHLTCHGYFDPANPLDSGLILSDGQELPPADFRRQSLRKRLDHLLSVRQILANSARLDLLTLRACSTARVTESADKDERDGFAGALMISGANAVVAALWDVDRTSSQALLAEFYRRLARDPSVPTWRAFWDAQRRLMRHPERAPWSHPYHWAGLTLSGDWR
ncbi:CHAT domain-containing tetratricopeptide repeat protein [Streptomyces lutosisoli]|uniref:CHAT domain-containing protein n=1 Tax=Streptomyces lutosisoli TaxID=2665721 RepID=A0ABW2VIY7_9ACTN